MSEPKQINSDEASLYDRQIRLWGVEAQNRLRNSSVLLIGLNLVGAEIAKNLILAGVRKLDLYDSRLLSDCTDNQPVFLLSSSTAAPKDRVASAVLDRCRQLNPLVEVSEIQENIFDAKFSFSNYNIVCIVDFDRSKISQLQLYKLDEKCRKENSKFVVSGCFGEFGYSFFDFDQHVYFESDENTNPDDEDDSIDNNEDCKANGEPVQKKARISSEKSHLKKIEMYENLEKACSDLMPGPEHKRLFRKLPNGLFFFKILNQFCLEEMRNPSSSNEDHEKLTMIYDKLSENYCKAIGDLRFEIRRFEPNKFYGTRNPGFAIIGGIASQQIITAISQNEKPINNFVFYDGYDCSVCKLPICL